MTLSELKTIKWKERKSKMWVVIPRPKGRRIQLARLCCQGTRLRPCSTRRRSARGSDWWQQAHDWECDAKDLNHGEVASQLLLVAKLGQYICIILTGKVRVLCNDRGSTTLLVAFIGGRTGAAHGSPRWARHELIDRWPWRSRIESFVLHVYLRFLQPHLVCRWSMRAMHYIIWFRVLLGDKSRS